MSQVTEGSLASSLSPSPSPPLYIPPSPRCCPAPRLHTLTLKWPGEPGGQEGPCLCCRDWEVFSRKPE